jgi:hypothetical protein
MNAMVPFGVEDAEDDDIFAFKPVKQFVGETLRMHCAENLDNTRDVVLARLLANRGRG